MLELSEIMEISGLGREIHSQPPDLISWLLHNFDFYGNAVFPHFHRSQAYLSFKTQLKFY